VTVCRATDDVHAGAAVGNEPTVGIHVFDPATSEAHWFMSGWDSPDGGAPQVRANL
jgi:3-mercaptopropionate dioxygenase